MKQLNESQEIEEPKKVTIHKWAKNTSNSSHEESNMNSNNFMYLDHKGSTFQRSLQSLQTIYCL